MYVCMYVLYLLFAPLLFFLRLSSSLISYPLNQLHHPLLCVKITYLYCVFFTKLSAFSFSLCVKSFTSQTLGFLCGVLWKSTAQHQIFENYECAGYNTHVLFFFRIFGV